MPMLPTVPMQTAMTLCTAPIKVAAPKRGTKTAATTINMSEKPVPTPPGIWRKSVRMFAAGTMSFFAKSPKSQHSAMNTRRLSLSLVIITPFQNGRHSGFPLHPGYVTMV